MPTKKPKKLAQQKIFARTNKTKGRFVIWYCTDESEREDFKAFSERHLNGVGWDTIENWLLEPDVTSAIKYYMKLQHTIKLKKLYDKFYEQAMQGDVQSAKFLMDFSKEFFADEKDELHEILAGIKVDDIDD